MHMDCRLQSAHSLQGTTQMHAYWCVWKRTVVMVNSLKFVQCISMESNTLSLICITLYIRYLLLIPVVSSVVVLKPPMISWLLRLPGLTLLYLKHQSVASSSPQVVFEAIMKTVMNNILSHCHDYQLILYLNQPHYLAPLILFLNLSRFLDSKHMLHKYDS